MEFPDESFDIVFFSWSHCCTDAPMMEKAVSQAWRVLKKRAILINLQGSLQQPFEKGTITQMITGRFPVTFEDEGYTQARNTLKYVTIAERKFSLTAEEEFIVNTWYDTAKDLLDDLDSKTKAEYFRLGDARRKEIRRKLDSCVRQMESSSGRVQPSRYSGKLPCPTERSELAIWDTSVNIEATLLCGGLT